MGICCGKGDETNKEIDEKMKIESKEEKQKHKLMLIGSGSSGKSTIFKQLNWLYASDKDMPAAADPSNLQQIPDIRKHVIEGIGTLIKNCAKLYQSNNELYSKCDLTKIAKTNPNIMEDIKLILSIYTSENDTLLNKLQSNVNEYNYLGNKIMPIWKLNELQETYKHKNLFDIADNIVYFFENADTIFKTNYMPSREDLLKARLRTTGLISTKLEIQHKTSGLTNIFEIWDAGGQRTERTKWVHQFQGVTALLFVAALSHYNQVIFEDDKVNAMHESIDVFQKTVNKKYFSKTQIILFLNKNDLFESSIKSGINLDVCFTNHKDWIPPKKQWNTKYNYNPNKYPNDSNKNNKYYQECYNRSIEFIKDIYVSQNIFKNKIMYTHITCATDKDNVDNVFWDVQNNILKQNLITSGFYPQP